MTPRLTQEDKRRAWLKAARRRNELIRLGIHRAEAGTVVNVRSFVFALAATLASAPEGRFRVRGQFIRWRGLDGAELVACVHKARVARFGVDDDLIGWAFDRIEPGVFMGAEAAGKLVALTAEERDFLGIRSMEAIDETRTEREARRAVERLAQDAARKDRDREKARANGETMSRAEYLAQFQNGEPWRDLGITREAYRKRQQRARIKLLSGVASASTYEAVSGVASLDPYRVSGVASASGVTSADPCNYRESGRYVGHVADTVDPSSVRRRSPEPAFPAAAGSTVEGGAPISYSSESVSTGIGRDGLSDESQPKSEAPKKETARLGRPSQVEDPREIVAGWIPSVLAREVLLEDLGQGDFKLGVQLALDLGRGRLLGLKAELDAGGPAEATLAAARAAALSTSTVSAERRAAP